MNSCKEITEKQIKEIINLYVNTNISIKELAKKYKAYPKKIATILKKNNIEIKQAKSYANNNLTLEQEAELIEKYKNGTTGKALCREYDMSYSKLMNLLVKYKCEMKAKKYKKLTEDELNQAIEIYTKFGSIRFVAKCLKISASIIKRNLLENGIDISIIPTSEISLEKWQYLHGEDEGLRLWNEYTSDISKRCIGKGNPMYNIPSPNGAGQGRKGWYKDFYFRSLRELCYLLDLDEKKIPWKTAESNKYSIKYKNYDGTDRTYRPNFLVNGNTLVEIKPKRLQKSPLIMLKTAAAIEFCKDKDLTYEIIDFPISKEKIQLALDNNLIKFARDYKERFLNYK